MAKDEKPKVGVYDSDTDTVEKAEGGGIPGWAIGLIVLILVILAIVFLF